LIVLAKYPKLNNELIMSGDSNLLNEMYIFVSCSINPQHEAN